MTAKIWILKDGEAVSGEVVSQSNGSYTVKLADGQTTSRVQTFATENEAWDLQAAIDYAFDL